MPGRNDPCPCGSGKKFKKCCGAGLAATGAKAPPQDVQAAFALYQQGDLPGAIQAAKRAISGGAAQAELYELLGVASYQLGDARLAVAAFLKQVSIQPENALAHNNLCHLFLEIGDWQSAYQHGQRSIELQPELASAYNNLGNAYKCGHWLKQAEDCYLSAINKGYVKPEAYVNLGVVQQEQGKWHEAENAYKTALQLEPDFFPALSNLAVVLQQLKLFDNAEQLYQKALSQYPDDVELLSNMGGYYLARGDILKAKQYTERALQLSPQYVGAIVNLGMLYEHENNHEQAVFQYEQALATDGSNATANYNLASIYHQRGETQLALEFYRAAIKADPFMAIACAGMAKLYLDVGKRDMARDYLDRARELDPENSLVVRCGIEMMIQEQQFTAALEYVQTYIASHIDDTKAYESLVQIYEETGDYQAAAELCQELLGRFPLEYQYKLDLGLIEEKRNNLDAAMQLVEELLSEGYSEPHIKVLQARVYVRQKRTSDALQVLQSINKEELADKRTQKFYLLEYARVLDKLGRYPEAFDKYVEANNIRKEINLQSYNDDAVNKYHARNRSVFSTENALKLPGYQSLSESTEPCPIFIVGFPRSGTTLMEQIITAHPQVVAGGELIFIQNLVGGEVSRILGTSTPYPELLTDTKRPISQEDLRILRDYYLDSVRKNNLLKPGITKFTDKMPLNLVHLGFISMLFPESPILHMVRHPLDACFSSYISDFVAGNFYTATLEDTARHYAAVMELLRYYKSVLKMNYMEMKYEDLIADQEAYSRRAIEFVGLPWNEQCLKFYESKRVANTASYAQVTQKIYNTSKYRYKQYYSQLQPMVPILQEAIDYFGYSVEP